jgi:hypothetical protein
VVHGLDLAAQVGRFQPVIDDIERLNLAWYTPQTVPTDQSAFCASVKALSQLTSVNSSGTFSALRTCAQRRARRGRLDDPSRSGQELHCPHHRARPLGPLAYPGSANEPREVRLQPRSFADDRLGRA